MRRNTIIKDVVYILGKENPKQAYPLIYTHEFIFHYTVENSLATTGYKNFWVAGPVTLVYNSVSGVYTRLDLQYEHVEKLKPGKGIYSWYKKTKVYCIVDS